MVIISYLGAFLQTFSTCYPHLCKQQLKHMSKFALRHFHFRFYFMKQIKDQFLYGLAKMRFATRISPENALQAMYVLLENSKKRHFLDFDRK
jgi:hypothetical protein